MAFLAYYAKASGQELVDMMVASDLRDAKYEELKKLCSIIKVYYLKNACPRRHAL